MGGSSTGALGEGLSPGGACVEYEHGRALVSCTDA